MKNLILIALLIPCISSFAEEKYTLQEAAAAGIIRYGLSGNSNSSHYFKPLKITVQNLKQQNVRIVVGLGTIFEPDDSSYQNFIITNEEMICLLPGEQKQAELFAMCMEASDRAPTDEVKYSLSLKTGKKLQALLQLISDRKYFKPEGQYAVWAACGQRSLEDICGYDTTAEKELMRMVADITGQPVPTLKDYSSYRCNYYNPPMKLRMGGSFDYKLSQPRSISIAMFDKNNIVVRELFKNDLVKAGQHHFEYYFDASAFTDDYYFIRLMADGVIKLELKVDMP